MSAAKATDALGAARDAGFKAPAEWAPHRGVWVAAPHIRHEWGDHYDAALDEWIELVRALGTVAGEPLEVLVATDALEERLRAALAEVPSVRFHREPYGDVWTRDTAPIGLLGPEGQAGSVRFAFNGWGNKFDMPGDKTVGDYIAGLWGGPVFRRGIILEGGAIDVDGEGSLLTTSSCLFEPNRNPSLGREELEAELRGAFGVESVLWVGAGLLNDLTDGHIDTIARFVAPGRVACMAPESTDDPNYDAMLAIIADVEAMVDARGRRLEVIRLPSPGLVPDDEGEPLPASYCNFYIGNRGVIVPTYGVPADEAAVATIAALFPEHEVVGRSCRAIITGGGGFHCMTQQIPKGQS